MTRNSNQPPDVLCQGAWTAGDETTQRVEWYHSWRVALDNINIHVAYIWTNMGRGGKERDSMLNPRPHDYHIYWYHHSPLPKHIKDWAVFSYMYYMYKHSRKNSARPSGNYTNGVYIWCIFKPSKPSPHWGVTWLPCRRVYYIVRQHTVTAWRGPGLLFFVVLSCSLLARHSLSSCRKTNVNPRDKLNISLGGAFRC